MKLCYVFVDNYTEIGSLEKRLKQKVVKNEGIKSSQSTQRILTNGCFGNDD